MTCGPRKQSEAFAHHGGGPFQEHQTGAARSKTRFRYGLPVQASQFQAAGQARYGVSWQVQGHLRSWVLLAPAQGMQVRDLTENARGVLGTESHRQCGPRQANRKRTEETWLDRADRMAMSTERPRTIGEKAQ